jgi:hypothetical protein
MTSAAELHQLIERSIEDPSLEPAFLRALLDATLYVHLPMSEAAGRVRVVTFTRPDGMPVVPVFTDAPRAAFAGRGAVRTVPIRGRELFQSLPGATFMLDPNDTTTTIYPEEVAALLATGLAVPAPTSSSGLDVGVGPASIEDRWVAEAVRGAVSGIPEAQTLHFAVAHEASSENPTGFLLIVGIPDAHAQRVARAITLALQSSAREPDLPVDVVTYDPEDAPEWVGLPGMEPIWRREASGTGKP